MGYPVSHSRSPVIHRLFAQQTAQNIQYELLEVPPDKLQTAIRQFESTGGKGLNITLPHKSEVTKLVDEMSERASNAGAVNTLVFREGKIFGDNTDGVGLLRDLQSHYRPATGRQTQITDDCQSHHRQSKSISGILFLSRSHKRVPFSGCTHTTGL
jgi:shikimate 5-dehydrogenase